MEEIAGAIGDYGTLFPIVLGVAVVSNVNTGHILLFFSLWYIITGLYYKMPMPVEPMKVVGAVIIANGLNANEIVASGIIIGVIFLALGYGKIMRLLRGRVPTAVVRGIQLGLALLLLKTSIRFITGDYWMALGGIAIIFLFILLKNRFRVPDISALVVMAAGILVGCLKSEIPPIHLLPIPSLIIPTAKDFLAGGWLLALPQIPLTITNAILATSLLMQDLIHKKVEPDRLAKSIGYMNILSVPFGGFPMCHGAGGLAAQYRFGARTGGSNIISGIVLLPLALFFAAPQWVEIIPLGVFGALLVFVALELGKHGFKTDSYPVTIIVALLTPLLNVAVAFLVGLGLAWIFKKCFF